MNGKNISDSFKTKSDNKTEFDIKQILQIINRRKIHLYISVISILLIVFIYNKFSEPIYQTSILLKKEKLYDDRYSDQLNKIIAMQTADEIETEMEIIKSQTVLEKVVNKLKLFFIIDKVQLQENEQKKFNFILEEYENFRLKNESNKRFYPQFLSVEITNPGSTREYYIEPTENNTIKIYDTQTDSLIQFYKATPILNIELPNAKMEIYWPYPLKNVKIYFKIKNLQNSVINLSRNISMKRIGKTNIFKVYIKSNTPFSVQLIANTLVNKFIEARLEQKQQTIHYSYDFVNEQLNKIENNLKSAEDTLSKFKSKYKIMEIDKNSSDLVDFLSNLEAEKINVDLALSEYKNRLDGMRKEYQKRGFIDQTYLTPEGRENTNTPFSDLLRQLSNLELQRLGLLQKRKENHPDVIRVDTQIKKIKERLSTFNQHTMTAYQIIINSLKEKRYNLQNLINKYSNRIKFLPKQETHLAELIRQKSVYEKIFSALLDKREEMRMAELSQLQDIILVDPAHKPINPVSPKKKLNLILALISGVVVGLFTIFITEYFDERLTGGENFENEFQLPILTIIPPYDKKLQKRIKHSESIEDRLVTLMNDQFIFLEAFRTLRMKLTYYFKLEKNILMITSCEENTGKTTIASNLAISLINSGKKVLIIDADLKKGKMGELFDITNNASGLLDFLEGKKIFPEVYSSSHFNYKNCENLFIIPAGGICDQSSEVLGSNRMKSLISSVQNNFDFIIIDTPPITKLVDTFVLGNFVKDLILIVRPNHTYKESIRWAHQEIEQAKLRLHGIVMNAGKIEKSSYRYRYGYGYNYHYEKH